MNGRIPARERLIQAAMVLFYEQGIRATGIDTIIKHAGVARMSLYNNFASKDDLVRAYLERSYGSWAACYGMRILKSHSNRDAILAIYDAHIENFESSYAGRFRGCPLLNAACELSLTDPSRQLIAERKNKVVVDIAARLERVPSLPHAARSETAKHLSSLLEGALCISGLEGNLQPIKRARAIASALLIRLLGRD